MTIFHQTTPRGRKIWRCRQCEMVFFSDDEDIAGMLKELVRQYRWHTCGGNRLGLAEMIGVEVNK